MSKKTLFHFGAILFLLNHFNSSFAGDRESQKHGAFSPQRHRLHKANPSPGVNPKKNSKLSQHHIFQGDKNLSQRLPNLLSEILVHSHNFSQSQTSHSRDRLSKSDIQHIMFGETSSKTKKTRFVRKNTKLERENFHPSKTNTSKRIKQPQPYSKHERKRYIASVSSSSHDIFHAQGEQQKKIFSPQQQEKQQRAAYLKSIRYNEKYPRHLAGKPGPSRQQQHDAKIKRIHNTLYSDQVQQ